jgi:hypothetical protein
VKGHRVVVGPSGVTYAAVLVIATAQPTVDRKVSPGNKRRFVTSEEQSRIRLLDGYVSLMYLHLC